MYSMYTLYTMFSKWIYFIIIFFQLNCNHFALLNPKMTPIFLKKVKLLRYFDFEKSGLERYIIIVQIYYFGQLCFHL